MDSCLHDEGNWPGWQELRVFLPRPRLSPYVARDHRRLSRRRSESTKAHLVPEGVREGPPGPLLPEARVPKTLAEALRLAADLEDERSALAAEVKELAPEAEFYDKVAASTGLALIGDVAKTLGFGRS